MNQEYKCPYCGSDSYAKNGKKEGKFTSWLIVNKHISSCIKNDKSFLIDNFYGPLPISAINNLSALELKIQYPNLKVRYKRLIKNNGKNYRIKWSEDTIIQAIKAFYIKNNKIPAARDFNKTSYEYPNSRTVRNYFGTWNSAIEKAGFIPNIQNGYGIDTKGLYGHTYRSKYEAYFADNYLFGTYDYVVEPKYPEPYNKYYDWYIPSIDLYIELDGGIRPEITKEKLAINKLLNRKLLLLSTQDIYSNQKIEKWCKILSSVKDIQI
jgi:hypothetical protein